MSPAHYINVFSTFSLWIADIFVVYSGPASDRAAVLEQSLGSRGVSSSVFIPGRELSGPILHPHQSHPDSKNQQYWVDISYVLILSAEGWSGKRGRVKKRFKVKYDSNPQRKLVHTPKIVTRQVSERHWVVSNSLQPHGLQSPWNSPGQNTGVGTFPSSRGSSQCRDQTQVSHIAGRFFTIWATRGAPFIHKWL